MSEDAECTPVSEKVELSDAATRFFFYKNTFYKNSQAQIWK